MNGLKVGSLLLDAGFTKQQLLVMTQEQVEAIVLPALAPPTHDVIAAHRPPSHHRRKLSLDSSAFKKDTTRLGFLRSVEDDVGPKPAGGADAVEAGVTALFSQVQALFRKEYDAGGMAEVRQDHSFKKSVGWMVEEGFSMEDAEHLVLLQSSKFQAELCRSLEEKDSQHAAVIHRSYDILAGKARAMSEPAERVYANMGGGISLYDLAKADRQWARILEADEHGFRGFTSCAQTKMTSLMHFSNEGDYDLVCLVSKVPSAAGLHTAIKTSRGQHLLPPLALYEVLGVDEGFSYTTTSPSSRQHTRRLITVSVTYRLSASAADSEEGAEAASKLATNRTFLSYGSSKDSVRGLGDVVRDPAFTMEQEFARDDRWYTWGGGKKLRSAREEYRYVVEGRAVVSLGDTRSGEQDVGRDAGHEGWALEQFVQAAGEYVDAAFRRQLARRFVASLLRGGGGCGEQAGGELPRLTREEVIALRLYTGPAYVPLNTFMREVAMVGGEWRSVVSRFHKLTYAATAGHVCSGLRKLVRVNDDSKIFPPLFRGLKGELPEVFWLRDSKHLVTATDFGFMSTSAVKATSVSFLGKKTQNLLWELQCGPEDSTGFHSAADVEVLSQYPAEREVLFPPLTMLQVVEEDVETRGVEEESDGFKYRRVRVIPTFV
jgi:hypothetical protein